MPAERRIPDFLILGAAKSGTTSLYHYLGQHPDVLLSEPKEPVFFEAEYERGLEFYRRRYFSHWSGQAAVGEARVYNLYLPYVPERIRASLPGARLIALLRSPVDRAFSHWWHRYSRGMEREDFETALETNLERLRGGERFEGAAGAERWRRGLYWRGRGTRYGTYLDGGYYAEQLERYLERFPPAQLKVVLFDELARDPVAVTRDVWTFLGVAPGTDLGDASARNVARDRVRPPLAARLDRTARALGIHSRLPVPVRRLAGRLLARSEYEAPAPAVDARVADWLREHYRPHNERLEALLGLRLPDWDQPSASRSSSS